MKKLVEITLAPNDSGVLFSLDGARLSEKGAISLIENGCTAYLIRESIKEEGKAVNGVLVIMPEDKYEQYKKEGRVD